MERRVPSPLRRLPRWSRLAGSKVAGHEDPQGGIGIRHDLNVKLVLFKGDICSLPVDAIVCSTNEPLTGDPDDISGRIMRMAGAGLAVEIRHIARTCHAGSFVTTGAYNLPAKFIVHTVPPRWSAKYQTAAESSLHACYRSAFQVAAERSLASIAIPVISRPDRGFPRQAATHIALRTIRKSLEQPATAALHTVGLVVDSDEDLALYRATMALYFPRTPAELRSSHEAIAELGAFDDDGGRIIEPRQIRIGPGPGSNLAKQSSGTFSDIFQMKEGPDEARQRPVQRPSPPRTKANDRKREELYADLLTRASSTAFDDFDMQGWLYQSGTCPDGRPIIVVAACNVVFSKGDRMRMIMYVIRKLDRLVDQQYVVVYCHNEASRTGTPMPDFAWIQRLYRTLTRKYRKHLECFYILHPTRWVRLMHAMLRPFVSSKVVLKVRLIESLDELYAALDRRVLRLPRPVLELDEKRNTRRV